MDHSPLSISELMLKRLEELAACGPLSDETIEPAEASEITAAAINVLRSEEAERTPNRKAARRAYQPTTDADVHLLGSG